MKKGKGKKQIARLRNVEKWQRLRGIFGGPVPKPKPKTMSVKVLAKPVVVQHIWNTFEERCTEECKGTFESGHNFIEALKKRGYQQLGSGAYSTVLGKPGKDRVIKVTRSNQDDWIDYIQWAARKGYCGNFAPRVYSWKKFSKRNTFSVSVVERMQKEVRHSGSDYALIEHLLYPATSGITLAKVYLEDLMPGSVEFFKGLTETFAATDIYGKNMMIRPDGSFCVTDPVCGRQKTNTNRLRSRDFTSLAPAIRRFYENCYSHSGQKTLYDV